MIDKVKVVCPECGKEYNVSPSMLGKKVKCKGCGHSFVMEESSDGGSSSSPPSAAQAPPASAPKGQAVKVDLKENFTAPNPDALMGKISKSGLTLNFIFSLLLHVGLIGGLSVGFIQLCIKYNSMDPKAIIAEEEVAKKKAEEERLRKERQEKAKQEALQKAKDEAERKKREAEEAKNGKASGNTSNMSEIEKTLQETSDERPTTSSLDSIDAELDL